MSERSHSTFLLNLKPLVSESVGILARRFGYASALGTDDRGISFAALPAETRVGEPLWVQRGFVFRAQRNGRVAEYACAVLPGDAPAPLAERIGGALDILLNLPGKSMTYPPIPDPPLAASFACNEELDPFLADPESILARLAALRDTLPDGKHIVMANARADFVDVSRMFVSPMRDLVQSFPWSQAYLFGISRRGQDSRMSYRSVSGRKGLELLGDLECKVPELRRELLDLLDSVRIEPGEYQVILDPDVAGTLAHESFGHGLETDMFLKRRAMAVEYVGKRVGSDLVTMYDGAADVDHTGSFLFDDEGNTGSRTMVLENGILKGGISDALSALALGIPLTGNGRRQAFSHKAYARMTNTYFAPGTSKLDEMVASVKKGWLLSRLNAGMEDPKNWGIQLVCLVGREIADGKFTGRVASPVVCTGFVPDVLQAIDMVSDDFALAGSGMCGKGYKEYVKVSSGGPYVRTRMRLG